mmetsp:Transcript_13489/g.25794  ORF Transcript_13489/g.25794 Transcript_13489/m.25794 type:complete len:305 (+) Transcript_13489:2850-3764(+)
MTILRERFLLLMNPGALVEGNKSIIRSRQACRSSPYFSLHRLALVFFLVPSGPYTGGGLGLRSGWPCGNASTRAASYSKLDNLPLAMRRRDWREANSCLCLSATPPPMLPEAMPPEAPAARGAERPRAAMTGSAAATATGGAVAAASFPPPRAHRDRRVVLSPPSSPALAQRERFFLAGLFPLPPVRPLFEFSVNNKYSLRTSFHPSHLTRSCQKAGKEAPYFSLRPPRLASLARSEWLYHAFILTWSARIVAINSEASSASWPLAGVMVIFCYFKMLFFGGLLFIYYYLGKNGNPIYFAFRCL